MSAKNDFPYAQLFEAIPIGLYRRTVDGRLLDVNPALVEASGWPTREALLACPVRDMYADEADLREVTQRMARDGVLRHFETKLFRHDRSPLWVEINAVAVCDEAGEITCYEGTITPIAERKQMELELRRSERRLRAIMDALDEIVAILDCDQRFVAVLGSRLKETGFTPEMIVGRTLRQVFGRETGEMHQAHYERALGGERVVYEWQTDLPSWSHSYQISLFPLREPTGEIIGLVATAYDTTHLKLTQDRLAHALAEKDALLKEVHHRVKNNLQIISSLLNLQFDRVHDPGLRAMVMESQQRIRAMALVHEQLYRSETLMRLDTRVFLYGLVSSLVRSYSGSVEHVESSVQAEAITLDLDVAIPVALIINELVSNSLKHAFCGRTQGNRLDVALRRNADGSRQLRVRDNGVGMPAGLDIESTETLGLSLVANLVRQIEGNVVCRTESGTEFTVTF
jgi:PAS domain S-box-containing protein